MSQLTKPMLLPDVQKRKSPAFLQGSQSFSRRSSTQTPMIEINYAKFGQNARVGAEMA
jgi:hypothetical protein